MKRKSSEEQYSFTSQQGSSKNGQLVDGAGVVDNMNGNAFAWIGKVWNSILGSVSQPDNSVSQNVSQESTVTNTYRDSNEEQDKAGGQLQPYPRVKKRVSFGNLPHQSENSYGAQKEGKSMSTLKRIKLSHNRANEKDSFYERVRRLMPNYEEAVQGGYQSGQRQYQKLVKYALNVQKYDQQFHHPGQSRSRVIPPSSDAMTDSSLLMVSDMDNYGGRSVSRSSAGNESMMSVDSVYSNRSVYQPPVSADLNRGYMQKEQQWIKKLRSVMNKALRDASNAPVPDLETPSYDELVKSMKKQKQKKSAVNAFPPLDDKQAQVIQSALATPAGQTIINKFKIIIESKDLKTVSKRNWLNDEVINFYMAMIMDRSQRCAATLPKVHVFNSFFYPKLIEDGYPSLQSGDYSERPYDMVLIPIHLGAHWCMSCIDFRQKTCTYYDSLHGSGQNTLSALRLYLEQESLDKKKRPFDFTGWTFRCDVDIPAQENGYDCGVFALTFAEHLSRDADFAFTQKHMGYIRSKIIYEIATGQLLISE
ncbi:hypothetical protein MIR68_009642 [Amoeboaphelidium protococcarum]|nr:hypothetical protein MIR68_009642 [Amoeboaphelidium protococcarum]